MTENKVFEEKIEGTTNIESYKLVTNDLVREALENDKGQDAQLLSWEIKPFTKKGDNYASIVACIEVKYHKIETEFIDSFVAKINPLRPPNFDIMEIYAREPVILSSIIGGMDKQLANLKLNNIRTPKVLSRNNEKGKEVFIEENLRNQGFKMHNRKIGLDLNHSLLVVNEIGRFHASSILFEEEIYPKTLSETFPDFKCILLSHLRLNILTTTKHGKYSVTSRYTSKRNWMDPELSSFEILSSLFTEGAEKARNFAQKAGPKYEKGEKWLSKPSQEIINIYFDVFSPKKPFDVLIHGDCWTNNMLFK
ncbi:hypothetical protein Anas_04963 [Armadillidium nasatum]|uniref:CHK kinase-like domain-containing protein n=1 Tax=Armadillidium nasatum TaxID=96803 RepID=A0A5N5T574_9CRUS|nr:hypothetical protein Anas_04963 [Armadillidium nasatum]